MPTRRQPPPPAKQPQAGQSTLPPDPMNPTTGEDPALAGFDEATVMSIPIFRLPPKDKDKEEITNVTMRMPKSLVDLLDAIVERNPDYSRHEVMIYLLRIAGIACLAQTPVPEDEQPAAPLTPPPSPKKR